MVEVALVKHSDGMEQLVDLFRTCFNIDMTADIWAWEYLRNPLSDPEVIVAVENGRIVGARPFTYVEMWLGNERVKAALHCDTMVHPDYQRRGIFNSMGQFSIPYLKERGYALSYGFPGPMSRPGYLRQGWKVVVQTETVFRLMNPQRVMSYKSGSSLVGGGLGFLYDRILNAKTRETSAVSSPFDVRISDSFTDELEGLDALRGKKAIDLVRSERYIRWRFDENPEHDYTYVLAKKGGELWGYAVVSSEGSPGGLVCGTIVDYLVKNNDISCFHMLISACMEQLERQGCDIAITWVFTETEFRDHLFKHLRFKSPFKFPYNRFFGYGHLDAIRLDEEVAEAVDVYHKDSWRVTRAFSDMS